VKKSNQPSVHSKVVRRVALVCILLITCFAFAEAVHSHPISSSADSRCDFCLAVHANAAAAPVASVAAVVLSLVPTQILRTEECKATSLFRGSHLYSRPPPSV